MVLSTTKRTSRISSIINRPTCGGTARKAGLISRTYWYLSSNPNLIRTKQTKYKDICFPIHNTIQTQKYGNSAITVFR